MTQGRIRPPGRGREVARRLLLCSTVVLVAVLGCVTAALAQATGELGCCAFSVPGSVPARRCAQLTRSQCDSLRPVATFFRGQRCDTRRQRCVLAVGAPAVPTSTATATPTPSSIPSQTPTPVVAGCCEVAASRAIPFPICGNQVPRDQCLAVFGFRASFCENCGCTSHEESGFSLQPGGCVSPTPTRTVPPTRTPTMRPRQSPPRPTATPTATPAAGCCEVPVTSGVRPPEFCGNHIAREVCLGQFSGARFCPDCVCSSHSGEGFGTAPGVCVHRPARPRPPRAPLPPRAPRR